MFHYIIMYHMVLNHIKNNRTCHFGHVYIFTTGYCQQYIALQLYKPSAYVTLSRPSG